MKARSSAEVPDLISVRSEEHTSELQSQSNIVCRLLLEEKLEQSGLPLSRQDGGGCHARHPRRLLFARRGLERRVVAFGVRRLGHQSQKYAVIPAGPLHA